ncbi:MAG TPA: RNA 2',3'-cyclic phosphodiesterase [Candidatus Acidoferrales bacterium]|nr:RNA 2',3'-cyclic phosphodiesterase [Candidatus Acidoferrales bacterium]
MRLFVAMDLNEQVRAAIANVCEKLRVACPSAKWVRVEGMHVTLKFIGWIAEEGLAAIQQALTEVRSGDAAVLHFRGVGFFPNEKRPRVLWIGVAASPNVAELAAEIEARLEPLGIAREKREFRPHLTLARFDAPRGIDPLLKILRDVGEVDFGTVRTTDFSLYQSELLRGGAKYTRLASFPFVPERVS